MRSGMNGDQKTTFQIFLECFLRDECRLIGKLPNLTKQKEHRRHGSISSPRSRPIISPQKISHLRITSSEHLCKTHTRHSLLSVTVCTKKLNTATSSANMMTARQKKQQSDQIIIGTTHNKIREETLKNSWDLPKLRKEGMQIESAAKGVNELNNESPINKMGKYSYKNMKKQPQTGKTRACHYCGQDIKASVIEHSKPVEQKPANPISATPLDIMSRYVEKRKLSKN